MSEPDARSEGEDSQLQAFITEAYTRAADDLEAAFKRLVMEMPGVIMGLRNQVSTAFTMHQVTNAASNIAAIAARFSSPPHPEWTVDPLFREAMHREFLRSSERRPEVRRQGEGQPRHPDPT